MHDGYGNENNGDIGRASLSIDLPPAVRTCGVRTMLVANGDWMMAPVDLRDLRGRRECDIALGIYKRIFAVQKDVWNCL